MDTCTASEPVNDLTDLENLLDDENTPQIDSLTITIGEFGHAAMVDNRTGEVVRILRQLADKIEEYGIPHADGLRLRDSNGNHVGSVEVLEN